MFSDGDCAPLDAESLVSDEVTDRTGEQTDVDGEALTGVDAHADLVFVGLVDDP